MLRLLPCRLVGLRPGTVVHRLAHHAAIVRDKHDPPRAWHVERKYGGQVAPLGPTEFLALLEDQAVLTLKIGADPVLWYSGARSGVPPEIQPAENEVVEMEVDG